MTIELLATTDATPAIGMEREIAEGFFRGVLGSVKRCWPLADEHYVVDLAFHRPVHCGDQLVDNLVLPFSATKPPGY